MNTEQGTNRETAFQRRTLRAGEYVFQEGDSAENAYIVQQGQVEIVKTTENTEKSLATIPEGGIFGEMALVDSKPRMAGARMKTDGTLIVVTQLMFKNKLEKTDPFIRSLLNIFVDQIRRLQEQ